MSINKYHYNYQNLNKKTGINFFIVQVLFYLEFLDHNLLNFIFKLIKNIIYYL